MKTTKKLSRITRKPVKPRLPDYAYKTIEEYEDIVGCKVNEAFEIGWRMARTTNAQIGI